MDLLTYLSFGILFSNPLVRELRSTRNPDLLHLASVILDVDIIRRPGSHLIVVDVVLLNSVGSFPLSVFALPLLVELL